MKFHPIKPISNLHCHDNNMASMLLLLTICTGTASYSILEPLALHLTIAWLQTNEFPMVGTFYTSLIKLLDKKLSASMPTRGYLQDIVMTEMV